MKTEEYTFTNFNELEVGREYEFKFCGKWYKGKYIDEIPFKYAVMEFVFNGELTTVGITFPSNIRNVQ